MNFGSNLFRWRSAIGFLRCLHLLSPCNLNPSSRESCWLTESVNLCQALPKLQALPRMQWTKFYLPHSWLPLQLPQLDHRPRGWPLLKGHRPESWPLLRAQSFQLSPKISLLSKRYAHIAASMRRIAVVYGQRVWSKNGRIPVLQFKFGGDICPLHRGIQPNTKGILIYLQHPNLACCLQVLHTLTMKNAELPCLYRCKDKGGENQATIMLRLSLWWPLQPGKQLIQSVQNASPLKKYSAPLQP